MNVPALDELDAGALLGDEEVMSELDRWLGADAARVKDALGSQQQQQQQQDSDSLLSSIVGLRTSSGTEQGASGSAAAASVQSTEQGEALSAGFTMPTSGPMGAAAVAGYQHRSAVSQPAAAATDPSSGLLDELDVFMVPPPSWTVQTLDSYDGGDSSYHDSSSSEALSPAVDAASLPSALSAASTQLSALQSGSMTDLSLSLPASSTGNVLQQPQGSTLPLPRSPAASQGRLSPRSPGCLDPSDCTIIVHTPDGGTKCIGGDIMYRVGKDRTPLRALLRIPPPWAECVVRVEASLINPGTMLAIPGSLVDTLCRETNQPRSKAELRDVVDILPKSNSCVGARESRTDWKFHPLLLVTCKKLRCTNFLLRAHIVYTQDGRQHDVHVLSEPFIAVSGNIGPKKQGRTPTRSPTSPAQHASPPAVPASPTSTSSVSAAPVHTPALSIHAPLSAMMPAAPQSPSAQSVASSSGSRKRSRDVSTPLQGLYMHLRELEQRLAAVEDVDLVTRQRLSTHAVQMRTALDGFVATVKDALQGAPSIDSAADAPAHKRVARGNRIQDRLKDIHDVLSDMNRSLGGCAEWAPAKQLARVAVHVAMRVDEQARRADIEAGSARRQAMPLLYDCSVALVIGVNNYPVSSKVSPLTGAVDDARAIALLLKHGHAFDTVDVLPNPTLTQLRLALASLRQRMVEETRAGRRTRVVVYFAGHGVQGRLSGASGDVGDTGYVIPVDGQADALYSCMSMRQLCQLVAEARALHSLVILDTCFAGLASSCVVQPPSQLADGEDAANVSLGMLGSQHLLVSCRADESYERNGHGVFTQRLISALEGSAFEDDRVISVDQLTTWIGSSDDATLIEQAPYATRMLGDDVLLFQEPAPGFSLHRLMLQSLTNAATVRSMLPGASTVVTPPDHSRRKSALAGNSSPEARPRRSPPSTAQPAAAAVPMAKATTAAPDGFTATVPVGESATATRMSVLPPAPKAQVRVVPVEDSNYFIGRDEVISQIQGVFVRLDRRKQPRRRAVITGLGGVGKTQAALRYATVAADRYDAVLFAVADSEQSLRASYGEFARTLFPSTRFADDQDHKDAVNAVKDWLSTHQRWLLILDNADEPRARYIEGRTSLIPRADHGHVLFTSRQREWHGMQVDASAVIEVTPLSLLEGTRFLFLRTHTPFPRAIDSEPLLLVTARTDAELAAAIDIVRALGGLALALEQAGAYLSNMRDMLDADRKFAYFLRNYEKEHVLARETPTAYRRDDDDAGFLTVHTTWRVTADKVSAAAREFIIIVSLSDVNNYPFRAVIREADAAAAVTSASVSSATLSPAAGQPARSPSPTAAGVRSEASDFAQNISLSVIRELINVSFVQLSEDRSSLSVHRLLHAVIRESARDSGQLRKAVVRAAELLAPLLEQYDRMDSRTHELARSAAYHALQLAETARSLLDDVPTGVSRLVVCVGTMMRHQSDFPAAFRTLQLAQSLRPDITTRAEADADIDMYNQLSSCCRYMGKLPASERYVRLALETIELYSDQFLDTFAHAVTLNNFGNVLYAQGRFDAARREYERAVEIFHKLQDVEEVRPLCMLAAMLIVDAELRLQGDERARQLAQAQAQLISACTIASRHADRGAGDSECDHPLVSMTMDLLGHCWRAQGRYQAAMRLVRRALAIYTRFLRASGDNDGAEAGDAPRFMPRMRHEEAYSLSHIGQILTETGKFAEAERFLQMALDMRRGVYGNANVVTAATLSLLGDLAVARGDPAAARAWYGHAVDSFVSTLSPSYLQHPQLLDVQRKLTVLTHDLAASATAGAADSCQEGVA